jgi:hypothetical protein
MKLLELFAGTKSVGKEAEKLGMEVFSSDLLPMFKTDYTCDILEFDIDKLPFHPDIIWASPPCTAFSVAAIGKNWTGGNGAYLPKTEGARIGIKIVEKTLEIIWKLKPKYFFIENPRGMLRKMACMTNMPIRHTITYCQYGDTRQKPTDIWTNSEVWTPKPMCKPRASCHEAAPRGRRTGTQGIRGGVARSVIPAELCREILLSCMSEAPVVQAKREIDRQLTIDDILCKKSAG